MDDYGQVLWLPVCIGLTGVGVLLSVVVWRRRGAASGLRLVSWSLLPIGLYLVGLLNIVVPFGFKLVHWLTTSVFHLTAWIGLVVIGLAVLLWVISGVMLGRRRDAATADEEKPVESGKKRDTKQVSASKSSSGQEGPGDDMGDIEDILKRRGIE